MLTTPTSTPPAPKPSAVPGRPPSARRLATAMAVLVATDLAGGVVAVVSGVNTWSEAWGPAALLAAPAPMVVGQVLLTLVGVGAFPRVRSGWSAAASVLLALACLVSVASGFVDGGLGHRDLTPGLVGYQVFLLAVTATVAGLAAWRAVVLLRRR